MFCSVRAFFLGLMIAGFAGQAAYSMESASDEVCAQRVQAECGDGLIGKCFEDDSKWSAVGGDCEGAVQTLIENEREAMEQGASQVTAVGMNGFAYGGKLRRGPGMNTPQTASIIIGDKITVLEDSGVWMNNYKWFKVKTPRGTGYMWGGIICLPGNELPEGIADNCQMMNQ